MVPLIIICIIALLLTYGRLNYNKRVKKNTEKFSALAEHVYDVLSDCDGGSLEFTKFMNDIGQYLIIAKGKKDNVFAVVSTDQCFRTKLSSKIKCDLKINWLDKKQFEGITCSIESDDNQIFNVVLCSKKYKANSWLGKMMIENAELFKKQVIS